MANMAPSKEDPVALNTFRFEDLPAELQVRIIEFAVIEEQPINITRMGDWPIGGGCRLPRSANRSQPGLSRVNKQIRVEALKAYYKANKFFANYCDEGDYRDMHRWLRSIGQDNRALIRDLTITELSAVRADEDDSCCFVQNSRDEQLQSLGAILTEPEGRYGVVHVSFPTKNT